MIYASKKHLMEVTKITHAGTFSTKAGMVQGKPGDLLVYDPADVVYVIGENPRNNPHNWRLVFASDFEKDFEVYSEEDQKLNPIPTDFGVHQFDENGVFLGYRSQGGIDAEEEAEENARIEAERARLAADAEAKAEAKRKADAKKKSDAEVKAKLDAEDAKVKADAEAKVTKPIPPATETGEIK